MLGLYRYLISGVIIMLNMVTIISCQIDRTKGQLLVRSPGAGTYEIYKAKSEAQLQFVAEDIGRFNETLHLDPGSYLILGDCSSVSVIILPEKTQELFAAQVEFIPPSNKTENGHFSIHCDRLERTRSRQNLVNQFTLNVLAGTWDILVGMIPIQLKIDANTTANSLNQTFNLSSLEVQAPAEEVNNIPYFVSPTNQRVAITTPEAFSKKVFLLPGSYDVQVNGTSKNVRLREHQEMVIKPAYLRISTPDEVDLNQSSAIRGDPAYAEINDGNWLNLNETYPIIPGTVSVKLNDSEQVHKFDIKAGEFFDMKVKSLQVNLNCSPWEWTCLGSKHVYLYKGDQPYPFAKGVSDAPILYYQDDVWVGIQGSRDLRYQLPPKPHVNLDTWQLTLKPIPQSSPQKITDLLRIEAVGLPFEGKTMDINLEDESTFHLLKGGFYLSSYHRIWNNDSNRSRQRRYISGKSSDEITQSVSIYVTEKRFAELTSQERTTEFISSNQASASSQEPNHARPWTAF